MKSKTTPKKNLLSPIRNARAFAPGHITGFFEIDDDATDPLSRGSRGAGVSLAAGVVTEVRGGREGDPELTVSLNGEKDSAAPVSRRVVALFFDAIGAAAAGPLRVEHSITIPQGAGFGSSGAGALSLALALNAAAGSPLSPTAAAQIAHRAEVECRTGLGTVLACTVGGLEIRTRAGAPGVGDVRSFPLPAGLIAYCLVFGPLSTQTALADSGLRKKIKAAGAGLAGRLTGEPTASQFIDLSRSFTEETGLVTPLLRGLLSETDKLKLTAAMPMFGEAVFLLIEERERASLSKIAAQAAADGATLFESKIAAHGGEVIDVA